jgi:hypothetical protein
MKKIGWGILCIILVAAVIVGVMLTPELKTKVIKSEEHGTSEAKEVKLELVYTGQKPEGVGSVQSFAITDDYFVIAGRPSGSAEEGGETKNQLMLITRDKLIDVTANHIPAGKTYELGHANGMTFNPDKGELVVVGMRNDEGKLEFAARIDARTFEPIATVKMPCYGSGIAYNNKFNYYMVRSGKTLYRITDVPGIKKETFETNAEFSVQDIGYYGGYTYLCNWVSDATTDRAVQLGLKQHQNLIYKVDARGIIVQTFIIRDPLLELESIDFVDGNAYVLMNGVGDQSANYFIYRVSFDSDDLK